MFRNQKNKIHIWKSCSYWSFMYSITVYANTNIHKYIFYFKKLKYSSFTTLY